MKIDVVVYSFLSGVFELVDLCAELLVMLAHNISDSGKPFIIHCIVILLSGRNTTVPSFVEPDWNVGLTAMIRYNML